MNISPPEISHMYHQYDFESEIDLNSMNNKLFCTFTTLNEMDSLVEDIQKKYDILYNKIFALYIKSNEEYVITYNVDQGNLNEIPSNTILVHRKKQTNTLYTINALNELIKSLNNRVLDKSYSINWNDYKNCILLVQVDGYKKIDTKIKEIINLS